MDEGGRPPGTVVFFHAHPDDERDVVGDFAAVYGFEWYARRGPAGPIDDLAS
ncbi:MAG: hypothetical protein M3011_02460 [Actinomycetota bacterium]|nr:hypothetical protein [Actinomycetota bacterium]